MTFEADLRWLVGFVILDTLIGSLMLHFDGEREKVKSTRGVRGVTQCHGRELDVECAGILNQPTMHSPPCQHNSTKPRLEPSLHKGRQYWEGMLTCIKPNSTRKYVSAFHMLIVMCFVTLSSRNLVLPRLPAEYIFKN
jgi:hypothetical protein